MRIFVLLPSFQRRKLRAEAWGIWKQKYILFAVIPMNAEWTISFKIIMIPSYDIRILKDFLRHSFWSVIQYSICYNCDFIYLLTDKASNTEFFQVFPCELYHT